MTNPLLVRMTEATRLVRAGDLTAATALIQRGLRGGDAPRPTAHRTDPATWDGKGPVIEGSAVRLDPAPEDAAATASPRGPAPVISGKATRPDPAPEGEAAASPPRDPSRRRRLRRGLGQTLRDLVAGHAAPAAARPVRHQTPVEAPPQPAGATFAACVHHGPHRTLAYRLYTPSGRADQRLPLVVMLHGCTQTPEDFAAGTRMNSLAEAQGFLVAYPAQSQAANPNRCWNWFLPEHQARDSGEPGAIAGMVRDILRDHPVDPQRVFVAGLSAGGATAAVMGAVYPDLFAAVGVHSGLASGAARDMVSAFAAMRRAPGSGRVARPVPTIVFHGDADATVHRSNADEIVAQITGGGGDLTMTQAQGQSAGGRAWTRVSHTDPTGRTLCEDWRLHGGGHAWSGGDRSGSYTDPDGPDASAEMLRFFLAVANRA